jgi:rhodanese-related sulfurtransferase
MSELHLSPALRRILLEALILTMFAFAVGLSFNYQLVMNAFTSKTVAARAAEQKAVETPAVGAVAEQVYPEPVELDEIDELLAEGALLVDARHTEDFRAGRLQGAVSLPLGEVATLLDGFSQRVPKERVLILYCNGFGCPDSFDLGVILLEAGYQQVRVYEGGLPEWRDEGRPLQEGLQ